MFGSHSFTDEIKTKAQAKSCVDYLSHNEFNFRNDLMNKGLSYEKINETVKQMWTNLLNSCDRVGFSNHITQFKTSQYNMRGE